MSREGRWKNNMVYFLDSRIKMPKVFIEKGCVNNINEQRREFTVVVNHDDYRSFKVSDYCNIVFSSYEEALEMVNRLPEVGQKVYVIDQTKRTVTEKVVHHLNMPDIYFENGEYINVTEVDKTLFLKKDVAIAVLKK